MRRLAHVRPENRPAHPASLTLVSSGQPTLCSLATPPSAALLLTDMLKSFAVAVGLCVLAAVIAAALGLVALHVVPCSWFGSAFEGGCAYGAIAVIFIATVVLAVLLAIVFNVRYFSRKNASARS